MTPIPDANAALPDVAHDAAALARPLQWVGMDGIALPVRIADGAGGNVQVAASVDVAVDLADADARGIHMSRLYLRLQRAFASETVTPGGLRRVLQDFIDSQQGLSTAARVALRYDHLLQREALASGHRGWKRYPVVLEASLREGHLKLALSLAVEYSSTCPASAALSRQLNADRFAGDFAAARPLSTEVVRDWLASERG
ncbi:MAG TPA: GTP cyclohydrolase, FolE2/MptA family, partial [Luteimonas sp.]|nr:GTP cyclohydrolase, FolE2/MptA family [Luteimonas sp.]